MWPLTWKFRGSLFNFPHKLTPLEYTEFIVLLYIVEGTAYKLLFLDYVMSLPND